MNKITEQASHYHQLENMSVGEILKNINQEDAKVASAVANVLPQVENFIQAAVKLLAQGGRLFYFGAGTSGRLGVLDASECPPTFGVEPTKVIGLIAGGDVALRNAVEHAEDDMEQAWSDLQRFDVNKGDVVLGISASGTTTYVLGGLKKCKEEGILSGSLACNLDSPISAYADHPIEVVLGPEFISGSTRMKAGTAQKMILNMISTSCMIKLGHVLDNKMIDMQLNNKKLMKRAVEMLMELKGLSEDKAEKLLREHGSVRRALERL